MFAFISDSQEELIAFADYTALGATAPDESSLILKLQATTEKILNWFDINQLVLNFKKIVPSYFCFYRCMLPHNY